MEWDNDSFNLGFGGDSINILSGFYLSNQNWGNNIYRSPSDIIYNTDTQTGIVWDGTIRISLNSDSTLTYRGVEIDYLRVLFRPEDGCNKGDIDHDGIINVIDIVNLVNFVFETATPVYYQECTADMNSDEILNVLDVVLVVDLIFGIDN